MKTPAEPAAFAGAVGLLQWVSRRFRTFALVAGALSLAGEGAAAKELGLIRADLGSEALSWHTITTERSSGTIASASMRFGPRLTELHVQGHPEGAFTTRDVFSIDVRYPGPYEPGLAPMAVDILYMPEGMGGPFWTSGGASLAPTVRVLALDVWGGVGRIDALFAGELCKRQKITTATDPATCREVTGRIETELFVEYGMARGATSGPGTNRTTQSDGAAE